MKEIKNLAYKFRLDLNQNQEKTFLNWSKSTKYIYNLALNHSEIHYKMFRKYYSYSISGNKEKKTYQASLQKLPDYGNHGYNLEIFEKYSKDCHKIPQFDNFSISKEFTNILKEIRPVHKQRKFENFIKCFYRYKKNKKVLICLEKMKESSKSRTYINDFFKLLNFLEKKEDINYIEDLYEKTEFFYKLKQINENSKEYLKFLGEIKKYFENPRIEESIYDHFLFLVEVPRNCLVNTLAQLKIAYKNFYEGLKKGRKVGTPNYKNYKTHDSFQISDNGSEIDIEILDKKESCRIENFKKGIRKVRLIKIGTVKFIQHKPILGKVKNVTVSKESNHWYISFCCENVPADILEKKKNLKAGIDLGVAKSIVVADENNDSHVYNINLEKINQIENKIKQEQKKLKAKVSYGRKLEILSQIKKYKKDLQENLKGSNRENLEKKLEKLENELEKFYPKDLRTKVEPSKYYLKSQDKIRKWKLQIKNIRKNFLHQTSYELVNKYSYIAKENLQVKNMTASAKGTEEEKGKNVKQKAGLNRSILTQGWGMFETMLEYKGEWYDCEVKKVDPKNTSRKCGNCGHTSGGNRKEQALFLCEKCGFNENADINAAKNILKRSLENDKNNKKEK